MPIAGGSSWYQRSICGYDEATFAKSAALTGWTERSFLDEPGRNPCISLRSDEAAYTVGLADSGLEPGTPCGSKLWFSLASSPEALFEAARRSTGERVEVERPIQMIVYGVPEAE